MLTLPISEFPDINIAQLRAATWSPLTEVTLRYSVAALVATTDLVVLTGKPKISNKFRYSLATSASKRIISSPVHS